MPKAQKIGRCFKIKKQVKYKGFGAENYIFKELTVSANISRKQAVPEMVVMPG